jgi:hypothetical protein
MLTNSKNQKNTLCPNHEGNFDCTPFCKICEGNQEYEGNEMNYQPKKLHSELAGFCEGYSYEKAHQGCYGCRETFHTIDQGINDVLLELEKRQIAAELYQSGGFVMLAKIKITENKWLLISSDGVGLDDWAGDWVDMSDYETYRNDFTPKDLLEWVANSTEKALKELKVTA